MKNKSKSSSVTVETNPVTSVPTIVLGRPVDPNSVRQVRLKEQEAKREAGLLKRGRPIVVGCKRQEQLEAREAKLASGIELKRGRPVDPNSPRQIELAKKALRAVARTA